MSRLDHPASWSGGDQPPAGPVHLISTGGEDSMSLRRPRRTDTDVPTRTIFPRAYGWPAAPVWRGWLPLGGDELRVRAWLWRVLGVGAAAAGRQQ